MSDTAPSPLPIPRCSDDAWAEARALIDLYVSDPEARFALRRAVIEYGKQEAFHAIDNVMARLIRHDAESLGAPAGRE